jgi:Helix-turn-helix domain
MVCWTSTFSEIAEARMEYPLAAAGDRRKDMKMARKFAEVEKEILADPKRRAEIEKEKDAMRAAVRLAELREKRDQTQVGLAALLASTQANVSRIERADNLYLTTLADYVGALGGRLEINAVFEDDTVPLGLVSDHEGRLAR